ncbi:MAG: RluA family pseudouridine synthase, partial [Patescibacteria group bacterium]
FLAEKFPRYSRAFFQKLIKNGAVLSGGEKTEPKYILRIGDEIKIEFPAPEEIILEPDFSIPLKIVYEDADVAVINKQPGLSVHPSEKEKRGTLANALLAKYPEIKNIGEDPIRPGIVHRLDKDTSGLMVVAKNNAAFQFLKKQFQEKKVEKKYLALVEGNLSAGGGKEKSGIIEKAIGRYGMKQYAGERKNHTLKKIREALTEYKVLESFAGYDLVEAKPKTGRMHQIRVHFSSIGHPLSCDLKYGSRKCPAGLSRHFLHSYYLSFILPSGQKIAFETDLPEELKKTLQTLKKNDTLS